MTVNSNLISNTTKLALFFSRLINLTLGLDLQLTFICLIRESNKMVSSFGFLAGFGVVKVHVDDE